MPSSENPTGNPIDFNRQPEIPPNLAAYNKFCSAAITTFDQGAKTQDLKVESLPTVLKTLQKNDKKLRNAITKAQTDETTKEALAQFLHKAFIYFTLRLIKAYYPQMELPMRNEYRQWALELAEQQPGAQKAVKYFFGELDGQVNIGVLVNKEELPGKITEWRERLYKIEPNEQKLKSCENIELELQKLLDDPPASQELIALAFRDELNRIKSEAVRRAAKAAEAATAKTETAPAQARPAVADFYQQPHIPFKEGEGVNGYCKEIMSKMGSQSDPNSLLSNCTETLNRISGINSLQETKRKELAKFVYRFFIYRSLQLVERMYSQRARIRPEDLQGWKKWMRDLIMEGKNRSLLSIDEQTNARSILADLEKTKIINAGKFLSIFNEYFAKSSDEMVFRRIIDRLNGDEMDSVAKAKGIMAQELHISIDELHRQLETGSKEEARQTSLGQFNIRLAYLIKKCEEFFNAGKQ